MREFHPVGTVADDMLPTITEMASSSLDCRPKLVVAVAVVPVMSA
jgi:hypothetical protein